VAAFGIVGLQVVKIFLDVQESRMEQRFTGLDRKVEKGFERLEQSMKQQDVILY